MPNPLQTLPTGTVTFLFTDIEGSTHLWQEKPEAMVISHARHDEILREAIESNHGYIFQIAGDSFKRLFIMRWMGYMQSVPLSALCKQKCGAKQARSKSAWDFTPAQPTFFKWQL